MQTTLPTALRDYLVRFQQTALKETGRRPLAFLRAPMDSQLVIPGCKRPGYVFWQPVSWPENKAPMGKHAALFHHTIRDYLSFCQFLEIRFMLPVAPLNSPLSFLHNRVFETYKNTESAPPAQVMEEAVFYHQGSPGFPLSFAMAATCDSGVPLLIMLRAEDGQVYIQRISGESEPLYLKLTVDRLLPKLQFVYDF